MNDDLKITPDTLLEDIEMSVRAIHVCKRAELRTVEDLSNKTEKEIRQTRGCGVNTLLEFMNILELADLSFVKGRKMSIAEALEEFADFRSLPPTSTVVGALETVRLKLEGRILEVQAKIRHYARAPK